METGIVVRSGRNPCRGHAYRSIYLGIWQGKEGQCRSITQRSRNAQGFNSVPAMVGLCWKVEGKVLRKEEKWKMLEIFQTSEWREAGCFCEKLPFSLDEGFLGGSDSIRICLQCWRLEFNPWVGKIPWRRAWQPIPVFLPVEFCGWRSLVGWLHPTGLQRVWYDWATNIFTFL